MEVFKFAIIPTEEYEKREQFRHTSNKCEHCHHALEFNYEQDTACAMLQEEAHCPACATQRATTLHRVN